jgi:hypothetical protein
MPRIFIAVVSALVVMLTFAAASPACARRASPRIKLGG